LIVQGSIAVADQDLLFHPDFVVRPYWWDDSPPVDEPAPLPESADVAIVGSGYCGLAAGLELARHGLAVAILDAGRIGEGASTRNAGMVSGGLKLPEAMRRKLGAERFGRLIGDAVDSFRYFESFLRHENFDAEYERCGRFVGAHSPGAYRRQERQARKLARDAGFITRMVPKSRQHEEIGSDFYHGGMVVDDSGGLNPARFHRSLRLAFQRAGGTLHSACDVQHIERHAGHFLLRTARGRLRAATVFVATNGYSGGAMPYLRRRIIPVTSFLIATEELPPDLLRQLSPKSRMLVDTKRILFYFRLSSDHRRILFGGRASFRDTDERHSARNLHRFMCSVWPQLQGTRITHAWKGNVAFTFDMLPHMGSHEGVHFAVGCQGAGVAMSTYLGHQTARKLLDPHRRVCAFEGLPFPTRWLYSGRPWFLPIVGNYYLVRDRIEQWTGW